MSFTISGRAHMRQTACLLEQQCDYRYVVIEIRGPENEISTRREDARDFRKRPLRMLQMFNDKVTEGNIEVERSERQIIGTGARRVIECIICSKILNKINPN